MRALGQTRTRFSSALKCLLLIACLDLILQSDRKQSQAIGVRERNQEPPQGGQPAWRARRAGGSGAGLGAMLAHTGPGLGGLEGLSSRLEPRRKRQLNDWREEAPEQSPHEGDRKMGAERATNGRQELRALAGRTRGRPGEAGAELASLGLGLLVAVEGSELSPAPGNESDAGSGASGRKPRRAWRGASRLGRHKRGLRSRPGLGRKILRKITPTKALIAAHVGSYAYRQYKNMTANSTTATSSNSSALATPLTKAPDEPAPDEPAPLTSVATPTGAGSSGVDAPGPGSRLGQPVIAGNASAKSDEPADLAANLGAPSDAAQLEPAGNG